jgi:U3 small nucleolar RNA-associated protein 18
MNGSARVAAYAPDGNTLLTSGGDGEVYQWDLRTRRCLNRTRDEGCVNSTAIDVSLDGRYFAAGSDSGVVNIYSQGGQGNDVNRPRGLFSPNPSPLKTIMNLTTVADTVRFNPDGQILAIASRMKKDSLRLVHLPSCTVFQNWPTARSPLQFVHSLDFSPGGGFMAVGNAKGKVLLYRLHHYDRA